MALMGVLTVPRVVIIVLNWNGLKDTRECLASVALLEYSNFEVMVVDNGSSDGSVAKIRSEFPQVILIENGRNLGYTGGNNIGIRQALERGADYVWLLNNDTAVEPDSLAKLVDEAERSPETGLVSPVVHYYDCPQVVQFMGSYVDFAKIQFVHVDDPRELASEFVQRHLVLYGTALLIKRSVVESIGYLAEKYFAYHEDGDYSLRALKMNFCTKVRLDSRIYHKDSRTSGKHSPAQTFYRTRNIFFLWKDNLPGFRNFFVPCYYLGMVIREAKSLFDDGNEKNYDACLNGFWAALRGKGGVYDPTFVAPSVVRSIFAFFVSWHPFFWINLFRFNLKGIVLDFKERLNIFQ